MCNFVTFQSRKKNLLLLLLTGDRGGGEKASFSYSLKSPMSSGCGGAFAGLLKRRVGEVGRVQVRVV